MLMIDVIINQADTFWWHVFRE